VNKKLYGMIDQTAAESSSKSIEEEQRSPPGPGDVQPRAASQSLDSVRGYGDDDDDYEEYGGGYGAMPARGVKRPPSPARPGLTSSASSSQRAAVGPSKRFHFGL